MIDDLVKKERKRKTKYVRGNKLRRVMSHFAERDLYLKKVCFKHAQ